MPQVLLLKLFLYQGLKIPIQIRFLAYLDLLKLPQHLHFHRAIDFLTDPVFYLLWQFPICNVDSSQTNAERQHAKFAQSSLL